MLLPLISITIIPARNLTKRKVNGDQVEIADNRILSFFIRLEKTALKWKLMTNTYEWKHISE